MNLVTGRPGTVLDVCIDRIGEEVAHQQECMLLVPTQYTFQAEKDVYTRLGIDGSFLIDVLSPERLKNRVFETAGYPKQTVMDEEGKIMLLSRILGEKAGELEIYRSAAASGDEGFLRNLSRFIAEVKNSGKSAEDLEKACGLLEESTQKAKMKEAAVLLEAYEQGTNGMLADREDLGFEMLKRLEESGTVSGKKVFVYGFDIITELFSRQLLRFDSLSDGVTLCIETDDNSVPDGRIYAPVNASLDRLSSDAAELGITVKRERIVPAPHRSEIEAMASSLYALSPARKELPDCIEVFAASTPRMEVSLAAAEIRRKLYEGALPEDFALVYPQNGEYEYLIQDILKKYSLNCFVSRKQSAASQPVSRFLLSSISAVSTGWKTADITDVLATGFSLLSEKEAEELSDYAQSMELKGNNWKTPFTYLKKKDEGKLARLNEEREKLVLPLLKLEKGLRGADDADACVNTILEYLESTECFDRIEAMQEELNVSGLTEEAENCSQVWNHIIGLLDQLHEVIGEKKIGSRRLLNLLEAGLCSMELAVLPPEEDVLLCGEIGNVRLPDVKELYVLGCGDQLSSPSSGLFTREEQKAAEEASGISFGMRDSDYEALHDLGLQKLLLNAKQRVHFSYAVSSEKGGALRPGKEISALKRIYPHLQIKGGLQEEEEKILLTSSDETAVEAMGIYLSSRMNENGTLKDTAEQDEAFRILMEDEKTKGRMEQITKNLGVRRAEKLSFVDMDRLYGKETSSVSRLETFAGCPYRHFISYGLHPQQEEEAKLNEADKGNILHDAAEHFTRKVMALPGFPDLTEGQYGRLMDEEIDRLSDQWLESPYGSGERGKAGIRRLKKNARNLAANILRQSEDGNFRPDKLEMQFGENGIPPLQIELPDGRILSLKGRIDRIDVYDGNCVRIVDYKSSDKKVDATEIYWGLQLQLLIYLAAVLARNPDYRAAGFFYCKLTQDIFPSSETTLEKVEEALAKKLKLKGISLSDVEILQAHGGSQAGLVLKSGELSKQAAKECLSAEEMHAAVGYAEKKAAELASAIYAGDIRVSPAAREKSSKNICEFCEYSGICGFEERNGKKRKLTEKTLQDITGIPRN